METDKNNNDQKSSIKELEVTTTEEIKRGVFSNQIRISHSSEQFVLDFLFLGPSNDASLSSRVIIAPTHVKRFIKALTENLQKYEDKYGEIPFKIEEIQPK